MPTPGHVASALASLLYARPDYYEAEDFYNGDVDEVIASRRLRELFGDTGHHFRVNYARTPIDALLERTTVQGITCPDRTGQALLQQVWADNQLGLEAKDVHRRAYEYGDAYLIGWPDDDMVGGVSLYAHDPDCVRVFYDEQNPRLKSHAIHLWTERGTDFADSVPPGLWYRINLYYPDRVEQWISADRCDDMDGALRISLDEAEFVPFITSDGPDGLVENPTPGIIPVFHFRTARQYGRPEHKDAYGPQNMINKLNITMMASVDFAGFPQRYVTTDSALDPTPQDAFGPPPDGSLSTEHGIPGLDEQSEMEAGPGSTWILSGSKIAVGQFNAAQTDNFLRAIESLIKQLSAVTDIPGYYFDRSGQMPSGESFRMAETPLNKKLSDRLAQFGVSWHEVFNYCLAVNGIVASDPQIEWAPPYVFTDSDSWSTAILQLGAGVPLDQIYRERGYSEELIAQWIAGGAEQRVLAAAAAKATAPVPATVSTATQP